MTIGVYKILNNVNRKFYIGSSNNIELRFYQHKHNIKSNEYLQNAFKKYGFENFSFLILEECEQEFLLEIENKYLNKLKPYDRNIGYNINMSATAPMLGRKHSDEAKLK